jgi:hypothetical protein
MFFDEVAALKLQGVDASAARAAVAIQYRNGKLFGDHLRGMFWGSAPISPQLERFLKELWGPPDGRVFMSQGYGSSECGSITNDTIVVQNIVVLLVESPDSGHNLETFKGEVVVHTLTAASSYLHAQDNPSFIHNIDLSVQGPLFGESWGQTLQASPLLKGRSQAMFFCTGDLGETSADPPADEVQRAIAKGRSPSKPSHIITLDSSWGQHAGHRAMLVPPGCFLNVVGRLKNVIKLPNGEFIAPEYVEGCLAKADVVEQICVVARPLHSFVVAIVVPKDLSLSQQENAHSILTHALIRSAQDLALPAFMIPRKYHISKERWSSVNGMMTHNDKLNRTGIFQHYASVIDELFASGADDAPDEVLAQDGHSEEGEISVAGVIRVIQTVSKSASRISATTDVSRLVFACAIAVCFACFSKRVNSLLCCPLQPRGSRWRFVDHYAVDFKTEFRVPHQPFTGHSLSAEDRQSVSCSCACSTLHLVHWLIFCFRIL